MQIEKVLQANDQEDLESSEGSASMAQKEPNQQVDTKAKQAEKMADEMTGIEKKIEQSKKVK